MGTFVVEIQTDNASFENEPELETNRILSLLQARLRHRGLPDGVAVFPLHDTNGNLVGRARMKEN